ncbi:MAG TPA: YhjD/YihY/BrkB family envelope integrity protein, partial [Anaeromyxobacteraceae bacterium]|nr:YhjD/YihY/BrkB family envelope integrity protein [Anaeromyxobacteraceae bacterium]
PEVASGGVRFVAALRAGAAAFRGEGLRLRAMALTYISIFSLLPAMMVTVSMVRSFPDLDRVRVELQDYLVSNLAVGARDKVSAYLDQYVFGASAMTPGLLGFALLLFSAVAMLAQVEHAVNAIWAVRHPRPRLQRWLTYWAALTVGPLIMAGSIALALDAHESLGAPRVVGQAAGVALTYAFFVAAYLALPATRVRFLPALGGGVVAGTAFELAKGVYAWAASHLFRFQAVYGSIAAIFVFLLWLYFSWTIFLFGARLAFVLQHHRTLAEQEEGNAMARELVAVRALVEVALAWWDGARPPDAGEVADRLDAPADTVRDVLAVLEDGGFITEGDGGRLTPARPLARTTLADVRRLIAGPLPAAAGAGMLAVVAGVLAEGESAAVERLSRTSLQDLCQAVRSTPPPPFPGPEAAPEGE